MKIDWEKETSFTMVVQVVNLMCSHFGYVALVTAGALFKLAVAATLPSYFTFLVATVVGSLVTYFPSRFLMYGLQRAGFSEDIYELVAVASHLLASPLMGAMIFNATLGWGLALAPMLAVGGVSLVFVLASLVAIHYYDEYNNPQELSQYCDSGHNGMFANSKKKNDSIVDRGLFKGDGLEYNDGYDLSGVTV